MDFEGDIYAGGHWEGNTLVVETRNLDHRVSAHHNLGVMFDQGDGFDQRCGVQQD